MLFGKPPAPARALAALIVGLIVVKLSLSSATAAPASSPIPTCATLAKNPVFGIAGKPCSQISEQRDRAARRSGRRVL
jgi:hypothetical protein